MREIKYTFKDTVARINKLQGVPIVIKVNKGRNKFFHYKGVIRDIFPAVFTFSTDNELMTYSICDVLTKNIKFFPYEQA